MATHDLPILGPTLLPAAGIFMDRIGNQVTATNEYGNQLCIVMVELATDLGYIQGSFSVPQNYVGTAKIIAKGILDGVMTSKTLGFGVLGLSLADNEAGDAAYAAQDIGNITADHADEDYFTCTITLSNFVVAPGETAFYRFFVDSSVNDYAGNILLTDLIFQYADV